MHVCQAAACKGNGRNTFCCFSRDFVNGRCVVLSNKGRLQQVNLSFESSPNGHVRYLPSFDKTTHLQIFQNTFFSIFRISRKGQFFGCQFFFENFKIDGVSTTYIQRNCILIQFKFDKTTHVHFYKNRREKRYFVSIKMSPNFFANTFKHCTFK